MNMKEVNTHPFNFDIDFDIFMEHDDEALTLLQNQDSDGKNFIA